MQEVFEGRAYKYGRKSNFSTCMIHLNEINLFKWEKRVNFGDGHQRTDKSI